MSNFGSPMNFARVYKYLIATLLVAIYLTLPATNLARTATLDSGLASAQSSYCTTINAANDDCPCTDEQSSGCCSKTFCSCACHAPLSQGLLLNYAPVISFQIFREPSLALPKVYRSIFVPPQNVA